MTIAYLKRFIKPKDTNSTITIDIKPTNSNSFMVWNSKIENLSNNIGKEVKTFLETNKEYWKKNEVQDEETIEGIESIDNANKKKRNRKFSLNYVTTLKRFRQIPLEKFPMISNQFHDNASTGEYSSVEILPAVTRKNKRSRKT